MPIKLPKKDKDNLRCGLIKKYGTKCHYCGIEEEDIFPIWGKIYGGTKRTILEIDHKDHSDPEDSIEKCVLACPICNIAKSDIFTYEEFKKIGATIGLIWEKRKDTTVD